MWAKGTWGYGHPTNRGTQAKGLVRHHVASSARELLSVCTQWKGPRHVYFSHMPGTPSSVIKDRFTLCKDKLETPFF